MSCLCLRHSSFRGIFPATILTPHCTGSLVTKSPVVHRSYRDGEGGDRGEGVEDDDKETLQGDTARRHSSGRASCVCVADKKALQTIRLRESILRQEHCIGHSFGEASHMPASILQGIRLWKSILQQDRRTLQRDTEASCVCRR